MFKPSYINLYDKNELKIRVEQLNKYLECCTICPHNCKVNRKKNQKGFCNSGEFPVVSSFTLHHGEEPVISGKNGSGTIFFGNCNLRCVFCQNHQISQQPKIQESNSVSINELAEIMLKLQSSKAHNINLVSPTHFVPQIVEAIYIATQKGLSIPIVYNSNGYESESILKLLDGIVDIYLPDIKYYNDDFSKKYSSAEGYPKYSQIAVKEMYNQVGIIKIDDDGIAQRGLIIRHLVLPEDISGSCDILRFISKELSNEVYISIMSQYYPTHNSYKFPPIHRPIKSDEYEKVQDILEELGFENGWVQDYESRHIWQPNFDMDDPFNSSRKG